MSQEKLRLFKWKRFPNINCGSSILRQLTTIHQTSNKNPVFTKNFMKKSRSLSQLPFGWFQSNPHLDPHAASKPQTLPEQKLFWKIQYPVNLSTSSEKNPCIVYWLKGWLAGQVDTTSRT